LVVRGVAACQRRGVYFIPPQTVQQVLDSADRVPIHDAWTRMKFDEGKCKSGEIYSTQRDPALRKEYDDYTKKKLEELNKKK
jgi:4-hydroxy-4-methyl-2-oxoglutarate aldolase